MNTTLRRIRRSKGVKQIWMAQQLGIHRVTYRNYESGRTRIPKSVLFHAAHLLNIPPQKLINEVRR